MGDPEKRSPPPGDCGELASALGPALREACDGRLGDIEWFRSASQRSGAATGFSTFKLPAGERADVVVKLPVGPSELAWTVALGGASWSDPESRAAPTPRVLASGCELGGYDLGWLVEERLPRDRAVSLDKQGLIDIVEACADFQAAARAVRPVDRHPAPRDWERMLHDSREALTHVTIPDGQRWNGVLKKLQRSIGHLASAWEHRPCTCWCHGDLHPGNVLRRPNGAGPGRAVLIDLGLVHAGHWVEDAVYLERQFWGRKRDLCGVKPVGIMARRRKELGLPASEDYQRLAQIRRVLMAACVPAMATREGSEAYTRGALEVLEATLPVVLAA